MESMYLLVIASGVFAEVMIVVSFVNTVKDFDRDSEGRVVESSKVVKNKKNSSVSFFNNFSKTESFFTKFLASTLKSFF